MKILSLQMFVKAVQKEKKQFAPETAEATHPKKATAESPDLRRSHYNSRRGREYQRMRFFASLRMTMGTQNDKEERIEEGIRRTGGLR